MPTVQEVASKANRDIAENLINTINATPADKLKWRPMDTGRDALDLLIECAEVNRAALRFP
jgi:hypothetical protein